MLDCSTGAAAVQLLTNTMAYGAFRELKTSERAVVLADALRRQHRRPMDRGQKLGEENPNSAERRASRPLVAERAAAETILINTHYSPDQQRDWIPVYAALLANRGHYPVCG